MREIKFRGKSSVEAFEGDGNLTVNMGDWIYGNLIVDNKQAYIVNGVVECTGEYISLENWCPVDIETVGQYTGLRDKNGVEIYEGDIVCFDPIDVSRGVVIFGEWENVDRQDSGLTTIQGWYIKYDWHLGDGHVCEDEKESLAQHEVEVIGNIYEHPELAKL